MIKFLGLIPDWVVVSFPIIRYVLMFVIAVAAVVLIATVLMQEDSSSGGANAITGAQESYYSQNKGKTKEGLLRKVTIAMASTIGISIVLFFVSTLIYAG
ncbi:MAG: preprotein translocase subunit SecG [Clostridia bacterium]|nr:preprotein translocase subunit SecG [Clostridia bacterium]